MPATTHLGSRTARALLVVAALVVATLVAAVLPATPPTRAAASTSPGDVTAGPDATDLVLPATRSERATGRTTRRWSGAVDVNRRDAVARAYRNGFARYAAVPTGWTGSLAACWPGLTSWLSNDATRRALNFARSLNGLAPVRFSPSMNARAQRTALMMSANRRLSHDPSRSWRCWSAVGDATAARSNLALALPRITSGRVIEMYLDDRGAGNKAVGHRRWLMHPFTTTMGNGSTSTANALTVIGPRNARRPNPRWTSWPSRGWFPAPLEPGGRWSLSSGLAGEDFSRATVRAWRNGRPLRTQKFRVVKGYGMPTIAWQMPAGVRRPGTYRVTVAGITRPGVRGRYRHTWTVRVFRPS